MLNARERGCRRRIWSTPSTGVARGRGAFHASRAGSPGTAEAAFRCRERARRTRISDRAVPVDEDEGFGGDTIDLGPRLAALQSRLQIDDEDLNRLSRLGGNLVELDLAISIDIAEDGWARVTYRHKLLNLSGGPFTRMARELWFEHTNGLLVIDPVEEGDHRVAIQRVHDTPHLAKFACQISPAIRPGEWAMVGYSCDGGQFVDRHYWREAVRRYTRSFSINLRHREGKRVASCSATEELSDGSEKSATEDLTWDYDGDDVVITLAREFLRPNQFVELRWKVSNEST